MKDTDKIKYSEFITVGNYIISLSAISLYYLDYPKKNRGGEKIGYIVSVIDTNAKEDEHDSFCKRIRNKKDAYKYFKNLPNYCKNFGEEGLMKVWDEVDKCFDYKITLNKDYTIHPWVVVQHAKNKNYGKEL
jgi:hypothetical protein